MSRDDTINMEHYEILSLAHKICNECQKLSKRCPGGLCGNVVRKAKEIYYNQLAEKVRENGMRGKQIEEMARISCNTNNSEIKWECAECPFNTVCDIQISCEALYNAGYRKQSEWISVEERLPESEGDFLVWNKEQKRTEIRFFYRLPPNYPVESHPEIREYFGNFKDYKRITHWMPLPEPPKMKGGAE